MPLAEGDKAPDFTVPTDGGGMVSLAGLKGGQVVLYFYPKDDTPGCTKEACAFRDALPDFSAADARIVGVSKDTAAKHDRFKAKYDLPFTLASDTDGSVCEAYGVWVKKKLYGREYMGIERATFLIGADGRVKRIWRRVKVPGHAEAVLDAAREAAGA
ncbi:MAG: thioredoxin-dependent thiol peroxidase [Rhodospirillaceae bacterium]|nr:thioredoxin-dependent thiol peroxidase [Rhodospirillaceae bacterium]